MTPPDRKELLSVALFNARRLSRDLGMMAPDALGVERPEMAHHYVRDRHASALHGLICDLEEAMEKEPTE